MSGLNKRSEDILREVHPDLATLVRHARKLSSLGFIVTEGRRSLDRQRKLVAQGLSKTLNSRHLTGHAVDIAALVANKVTWAFPAYATIHDAFEQASRETGIKYRWGGDWDGDGNSHDERFVDAVHYELPARLYPATQQIKRATETQELRANVQLAYGDRGQRVRMLQQALNISQDGIFGTKTREAVRHFQRVNGLNPTGNADYLTLQALKL